MLRPPNQHSDALGQSAPSGLLRHRPPRRSTLRALLPWNRTGTLVSALQPAALELRASSISSLSNAAIKMTARSGNALVAPDPEKPCIASRSGRLPCDADRSVEPGPRLRCCDSSGADLAGMRDGVSACTLVARPEREEVQHRRMPRLESPQPRVLRPQQRSREGGWPAA